MEIKIRSRKLIYKKISNSRSRSTSFEPLLPCEEDHRNAYAEYGSKEHEHLYKVTINHYPYSSISLPKNTKTLFSFEKRVLC